MVEYLSRRRHTGAAGRWYDAEPPLHPSCPRRHWQSSAGRSRATASWNSDVIKPLSPPHLTSPNRATIVSYRGCTSTLLHSCCMGSATRRYPLIRYATLYQWCRIRSLSVLHCDTVVRWDKRSRIAVIVSYFNIIRIKNLVLWTVDFTRKGSYTN